MGLFDKKYCDFCGGGIGLLGNRKLADGNMCKDCASKISPWVNDRRQWSVAEMQQHLVYRDTNYQNLQYFQITRVIGNTMKLYIDCNSAQWFLTRHDNFRTVNPDLFFFNQVTGCQIEIKDNCREVFYVAPDGTREPFYPPEYDYDYDFYLNVYVNSPFVQEISFKINDSHIENIGDYEYILTKSIADNMKFVFDQMASGAPQIQIPNDYCPDAATIEALRRERMLREERRREMMRLGPRHAAPPPPPRPMAPPPPPPRRPAAPPPPPPRPTGPAPRPNRPAGGPGGRPTGGRPTGPRA